MKTLYERVISADTRRRLGEYYTPDWRAEAMVDAAVPNPLQQRVLDPAYGSGTFRFHAARRHLTAAREAGKAPPSISSARSPTSRSPRKECSSSGRSRPPPPRSPRDPITPPRPQLLTIPQWVQARLTEELRWYDARGHCCVAPTLSTLKRRPRYWIRSSRPARRTRRPTAGPLAPLPPARSGRGEGSAPTHAR
jgi:N-6 DNA Methylase